MLELEETNLTHGVERELFLLAVVLKPKQHAAWINLAFWC